MLVTSSENLDLESIVSLHHNHTELINVKLDLKALE